MLRDMPFEEEEEEPKSNPIKKTVYESKQDIIDLTEEEQRFLRNQLNEFRKVKENMPLKGPPLKVRINSSELPIGFNTDKSDINSNSLEYLLDFIKEKTLNILTIGLLTFVGFTQYSSLSINKSKPYIPIYNTMSIEDKEPEYKNPKYLKEPQYLKDKDQDKESDYLKDIVSQNQQYISMQNKVLLESKQLTDSILTKLGDASEKDMKVKISLNTKLTNKSLDMNDLNQVVDNINQSARTSRISETSDNLEPPFMRTPHNSVASSFRPINRSSKIEPSISISVSKRF